MLSLGVLRAIPATVISRHAAGGRVATRAMSSTTRAPLPLRHPLVTAMWSLSRPGRSGTVRGRSAMPCRALAQHAGTGGAAGAEVLLVGADALRQVCTPCGDDPLLAEKKALVATLDDFRATNGFGRGIAAPQIGITRRFVAINLGDGPQVLADPTITARSEETITLFDDCMSLPWILCKVQRAASISVEFTDENGCRVQWNDLPTDVSELLQHELDHLDGVLIVDRIADGNGIVSRAEYDRNRKRFDAEVSYSIVPTISPAT